MAGLLALVDIVPEVRAWLEQRGDGHPLSARHLRYIGRAAPARQLALAREIVESGWGLFELRASGMSLEDIFLKLTTHDLSEEATAPEISADQSDGTKVES